MVMDEMVTQSNKLIWSSLRRIEIIRHPKLQISKNLSYMKSLLQKVKSLVAARNGEEMLEPYERETLT